MNNKKEMMLVPAVVGQVRRGLKFDYIDNTSKNKIRRVMSGFPRNVPQVSFTISKYKNNNNIVCECNFNKAAGIKIPSKTVGFKIIENTCEAEIYFLDNINEGFLVTETSLKNGAVQKRIGNNQLVKMMIEKFGIDETHAFATVHDFTDKGCIITFIDKNLHAALNS